MDCSPPGSSVHGVVQARTLEWVAISSSRGSSRPRDRTCVFCASFTGKQILYHWATGEAHSLRTVHSKWGVCVCVCACVLSHFIRVCLFVTPWAIARQAPLSLGFSRQEYWSGLPCPTAGDLPHPGIEPTSRMSPALAGGFFTTSTTWEAPK